MFHVRWPGGLCLGPDCGGVLDLAGGAVGGVSGYCAIRLLRFVAAKGRFGAFSYYCWAAGVITLALSVMKSTSGLPWLGA